MKLNPNAAVPMPGSKTSLKKNHGRVYVYYILRHYRNANGTSTTDSVCIGKQDPESGMLIPNATYYEYFGGEPVIPVEKPSTVQDYGNVYLLDHLMGKYDVLSTLKYAFPTQYQNISTLAQYMVCKGNVYYYCDDWCEKTYLKGRNIVTSQQSSKVCQSISYEECMNFFERWIYARIDCEYLAYDVTSISSYSKGIDDVAYGYNRDHEKLPQINIGMIYGEESRLPMFYNIYPGSIPDKCYLDYMLKDAEILGLSCSYYVMDRGLYTKENLSRLVEHSISFIIGMPLGLKIAKRLISQSGALGKESEFSLGAGQPFSKCIEITDYGFRALAHVYYDKQKAVEQEYNLLSKIENREEALRNLNTRPTVSNPYDQYFIFHEEENGKFTVEYSREAIDAAMASCGYFILLTTDFKRSSAEVLRIYRAKDGIEKSFDNLKNGLDMHRLRTHNTATTDGKTFIAFISLILKSLLDLKLERYMDMHNMTIEKIMNELSKIRIVRYKDKTSLLSPLTKKQKEIFAEFGIDAAQLEKDAELA